MSGRPPARSGALMEEHCAQGPPSGWMTCLGMSVISPLGALFVIEREENAKHNDSAGPHAVEELATRPKAGVGCQL